MSVIGSLFGTPGASPPRAGGKGDEKPEKNKGHGAPATTDAPGTVGSGTSVASGGSGSAGEANVTASANQPPAAGASRAASPRGTPSDAPAVRHDFGPGAEAAVPDDDQARAYAIAGQKADRASALVERLGQAATAPEPTPLVSKPQSAAVGAKGYSNTLENLRGTSAPVGALLDKAA